MYRDSHRDSIHRVVKGHTEERTRRGFKRRNYNVKGPNRLWHIDMNHKLIKLYLIIFGAINDFSRLPISLEYIDNDKAITILSCFLKGVNNYGMPSRVRFDKGKENVSVIYFMIEYLVAGRGNMITGRTTHTISVSIGFGVMCLRVLLHSITRFSHLLNTVQFLIPSMR